MKEAEAHAQVAAYSAAAAAGGSTGSTFVRDMAQLQRLRAAAANAQAKALAPMLVAGVGFHNAAMEPADRTLVEELFKAGDLAVRWVCAGIRGAAFALGAKVAVAGVYVWLRC